jgi:dihydroorotate dehydrogenase
MGLNGLGKEVFAKRMEVRKTTLPVGVNIAKTNDPSIGGEQAIEDILATFLQVKSTNPAYIAINASCPNTSEGIWSSIEQLDKVLEAIAKANDQHIPIFVKVSSDSSDELLKAIVDCAKAKGICGFICGNTTRFRPIRYTPASIYKEIGDGGLSGGPLKDINLDLVSRVYKLTGNSMEIIAVGGIMSGNDAYDYVLAGASSFQVYTGLIYYGPGLCYEILKSLEEKLLSKDQTLITARGLNTREAVA